MDPLRRPPAGTCTNLPTALDETQESMTTTCRSSKTGNNDRDHAANATHVDTLSQYSTNAANAHLYPFPTSSHTSTGPFIAVRCCWSLMGDGVGNRQNPVCYRSASVHIPFGPFIYCRTRY